VLGINLCITTLAGLITPTVMGIIIDHAPDVISGYRLGMMLAGGFSVIAGLLAAYLIHPEADRFRFVAYAKSGCQSHFSAPRASDNSAMRAARRTIQ
jgi:hypothetical protein